MKLTIVLASAFLSAGLLTGFAADPTPAAAAPTAPTFETQLQTLMGKIKAKLDAGVDSESGLSDEIKQFDKLIAAHRPNKAESDSVARAMYVEASLYMKVLQDYDKAAALLTTIKNDYPRSQAYFPATEALDQIDLQRESVRIQNGLKAGTTFPDFSVTDVKGAPLSVSKFRGKVVLVDFWATWCGPCVAELPNVLAAYSKYHDKGFEIVGVSLDTDGDKMKSFVAEKHMTWPQYFDGKGWNNDVSRKYGINSIPMTYLIGRDGKIVARNLRGPGLEQELANLLK
jgi:peroxiredoxin